MDEMKQDLKIEAERVLKEQCSIAFFDIRTLFDAEGRLLPIHEFPEDAAAAVASLKVRETNSPAGRIIDIKLWNKASVLESLSKSFSGGSNPGQQGFAAAMRAAGRLLDEPEPLPDCLREMIRLN